MPQPEAGKGRTFFDGVYDLYLTEGAGPAMKLFASSFVGFDHNAPAPGDQAAGTHDRFLAHEFRRINNFVPDVEALRRGNVPIVTLVGRDSGNAFYAQTAHELARQLSCPCSEIVGNHLGYAFHAEAFANELHRVIRALSDHAS